MKVALFIIIVCALLLSACTPATPCDKQADCCETNNDCEYVWYTGGCHTQEYVNYEHERAEEQGILVGEAQPRQGVTCTCEAQQCVTHG